jgi:hypothetical protein
MVNPKCLKPQQSPGSPEQPLQERHAFRISSLLGLYLPESSLRRLGGDCIGTARELSPRVRRGLPWDCQRALSEGQEGTARELSPRVRRGLHGTAGELSPRVRRELPGSSLRGSGGDCIGTARELSPGFPYNIFTYCSICRVDCKFERNKIITIKTVCDMSCPVLAACYELHCTQNGGLSPCRMPSTHWLTGPVMFTALRSLSPCSFATRCRAHSSNVAMKPSRTLRWKQGWSKRLWCLHFCPAT